jgi:alpha-1,2-glucosyltransferase
MMEHLRRGWLFMAGFLGFAIFVLVNRGVAMGDPTAHPSFQFRTGNIFFALLVVAVVFLPLHVANLAAVGRLLRAQPWWLLIVAAVFLLFWFGTRFDHPYNTWSYCLRNHVLNWMATSDLHRLAGFAAATLVLLSLAVTPFRESSFLLLYPVAAMSLAPCWLIDPRYIIPALSLFTLMRVRREWSVEWANLAWCALLSLLLLDVTFEGKYFL